MKTAALLYHHINKLRLRVKARRYRGNRYHCPLCGFDGRVFLPSPDGVRNNVRCPQCDSLERHRAQWQYGLQTLPFARDDTFSALHFTPEFCITDRLLHTWPRIRYRTSQYPQHPLADYCIDVQKINLPSQGVNVLICNHILEHVPDDRAALAELHRVLKPGGFAFVQVPLDEGRSVTLEDPSVTSVGERKRLFGQEDHVRIYGTDFGKRLEQAGFSVSAVKFWETAPQTDLKRFAVIDREPLFVCRVV